MLKEKHTQTISGEILDDIEEMPRADLEKSTVSESKPPRMIEVFLRKNR